MKERNETPGSRVLVWAVWIAGGSAIVAVSFFGSLFAIDYLSARGRDGIRAQHIAQIMSAVDSYYKARGAYPVLDDKPASELKATLVDGGFLKSIPVDPMSASNKGYRYYSDGKNYFGLLVWLEQAHGPISAGGTCLAGRGTKGSGVWGQPPDCPF